MARRRREPKAAAGAAAAAAAATAEDQQTTSCPLHPPAAPGVHATTLLDLPAEVLLEVAVCLSNTQDLHTFVSLTCKVLRQQLAGAAAAMLKARWLLRHRHELTVLPCAIRHGDVEVLEAVLALTAGQEDPDDPDARQEALNAALEEAAARNDQAATKVLVAAGTDMWQVMATAIDSCCHSDSHSGSFKRYDRVVGGLLAVAAVGAQGPSDGGDGSPPRWTFPDGGAALRRELSIGDDAHGAEKRDEMLGCAVQYGRVWTVRALLAAGADVGRAIDEEALDVLCIEMRGEGASTYRPVLEDLSRAGHAAVRMHTALALAARFGSADDERQRLPDPGDGGGGDDGMGGRAGAIDRALGLAPFNADAPVAVQLLLQAQVGHGTLDDALHNALWASDEQPFAVTKEVFGLLTAAGATAAITLITFPGRALTWWWHWHWRCRRQVPATTGWTGWHWRRRQRSWRSCDGCGLSRHSATGRVARRREGCGGLQ